MAVRGEIALGKFFDAMQRAAGGNPEPRKRAAEDTSSGAGPR